MLDCSEMARLAACQKEKIITKRMKKTTIAVLATGLTLMGGAAWAADREAGKALTAEQQQQRSALIQKYDANQDGILDNKEAKRMSKADKKALAKLGGVGTAKKSAEAQKGKDREEVQQAKEKQKPSTEANAQKAVKRPEKTGKDSVKSSRGKTAS